MNIPFTWSVPEYNMTITSASCKKIAITRETNICNLFKMGTFEFLRIQIWRNGKQKSLDFSLPWFGRRRQCARRKIRQIEVFTKLQFPQEVIVGNKIPILAHLRNLAYIREIQVWKDLPKTVFVQNWPVCHFLAKCPLYYYSVLFIFDGKRAWAQARTFTYIFLIHWCYIDTYTHCSTCEISEKST